MHRNDFDYKEVEYNSAWLIENNLDEDVFYVLTGRKIFFLFFV
jgi:hypothetical protein